METVKCLARRLGSTADALALVQNRATFIVDEAAKVLFARSELNLPSGPKQKPGREQVIAVARLWNMFPASVLEKIADNSYARGNAEEVLFRSESGVRQWGELARDFSELLTKFFPAMKRLFSDEEQKNVLPLYLSTSSRELRNFGRKETATPADGELLQKIDQFQAHLEQLRSEHTTAYFGREVRESLLVPEKQRLTSLSILRLLDALGAVRKQLGGGLIQQILVRSVAGENFGPSSLSNFALAIPFAAANEPKEVSATQRSTFLSPQETHSKTILMFLAQPWVRTVEGLFLQD